MPKTSDTCRIIGASVLSATLLAAAPPSGAVEIGPDFVTGFAYAFGKIRLHADSGISMADLENLGAGKLGPVRQRYERIGYSRLTLQQHQLLCDLYGKYNNFGAAQACLDRLAPRLTEDDDRQALRGKRALLYLKSGEPGRAMRLAAGLRDTVGGRYVNGLAAARTGKQAGARKIARQLGRAYDAETAFFGANLYMALGEFGSALEILTDPELRIGRDYGLASSRSLIGEVEPDVFRADAFDEFNFGPFEFFSYSPASNPYVEFMLGKAFLETGKRESAREHLDRVLAYRYIETYRDLHWMALYERGRLEESSSDAAAMEYYRRAIAVIEEVRGSILTELGRMGYVGDKQRVYAGLIRLLFANGQAEQAMHFVERSRSRTLVDLLSRDRAIPLAAGDPPGSRRLLDDYLAQEAELRSDALRINPQLYSRKRNAFQALRDRLAKDAVRTAIAVTGRALEEQELRNLVNQTMQDESVIGFLTQGEGWFVYVWNAGARPRLIELDGQGIKSNLVPFLAMIKDESQRGSRQYVAAARQLYALLVDPIRAQGVKIRQRVSFLPSGVLWYLPFAALHDGNSFIGERHQVRVLPSLTVFDALRPIGGGTCPKNLLIVGNPITPHAGVLPFAEQEAKAVARLFPGSELLLGVAATSDAIRRLAKRFSCLHIASHASFNPSDPTSSALILSPSGDDREGLLSVTDVEALRLDADLVVLSACETAVSEVSPGEELLGLTYAFLHAGASAVLSSLWQIEDEATALFMKRYYRALKAGSADQALQQAQRDFIVDATYHHPYYWAAFQLTGR